MTKVYKDTTEDIRECASIIENGGTVAFPTETVYGLGANAFNKEAVAKIYEAKGRSVKNPLTLLICEQGQFYRLTSHATIDMQRLARDFWPGPLTMVVNKASNIPDITTAARKTVGIRMPSNQVALDLIRYAKTPLATPSANISGRPSPTRADHVMNDLDGRIDAVIDGGNCELGIESTVIDMTGEVPNILRPGAISKEQIEKSLGKEITCANSRNPNHYMPKAEVIAFGGNRDSVVMMIESLKKQYEANGKKVGIVFYDSAKEKFIARDFYSRLRELDDDGNDIILVSALSLDEVVQSVINMIYQPIEEDMNEDNKHK